MYQRRITENEYDKYFQSFADKITEMDTRMSMLQEAEDKYYITAKYLLELANRTYDLFKSSEVEQKRQIIKLVLQNVRVEDNKVCYEAQKPFDMIMNYADRQALLPRVDSNHEPCRYTNPQVTLRCGLSHLRLAESGI